MANYLDIYSAYRNRSIWPNPAEFEVLISISGRKSSADADDPVALSSPPLAWTAYLFNAVAVGASVQGTITNASTQIITFTTGAGALQQAPDYYRGATWRSITDPTQYAKVTSYKYLGSDRGQVTLDSAVVVAVGDTFNILDPTDLTDPSNPLFFVPTGADEQNKYRGYILYNETLNQFRTVTSYDNTTGLLTVDASTPVAGWATTHNYSLRERPPVLVSVAAAGSTNTLVVLGAGAGTVDDNFYNGWFIRTPRTVYDNNPVPPQGEQRRIIAYDAATFTATVSPPFTASALGATVELLQFSYDNMYPFSFRATLQQDVPVYSISLNKLILPNKLLKVHEGGKTALHNYVYVELSSIDNPNNNVIFSNNPNAVKALFTASIDNSDHPDQQDYVVLNGDDMTQTVRFKLDNNLKFRVSMPNGETFETLLKDNFAPLAPNPKLQVRALFQLTHA